MDHVSPLHRQHDHERQWSRNMRIADAYRRGDPVADIIDRYGTSRSQVLRIARMFGLPKRPKWRITPEERERAMRQYSDGCPVAEIADEFGVSQAWVSAEATRRGIGRYDMSPSRPEATK
jgi:hypothetical protein